MEFRPSKRIKIVETPSEYPHVLQLFLKPPNGAISLEEFETITYDRVKLLRTIERASLMGNRIFSDDWKAAVIAYLKKEGLRKYANLIQSPGSNSETDVDLSMRREDHISHFILRLCYCRSGDLRNWFVQREIELFKLRFSNLSPAGLKSFIKVNGLSYTPISEEAKDSIKEGLITSTAGYFHADIEQRDFYKVPFQEVSDLVARRMVFLKGGFAYIPSGELGSCLVSLYRANLNQDLTVANRKLPYIDDDRVTGLLQKLHTMYNGKDYTEPEKKDEIEVADLDRLAKHSFPLCMRNLFDTIKQTHHMKHFGRLQFGLFLKGIGLKLEQAIQYWKGEFTKLIDEDKFNKAYVYNIKHCYGCIGKMANYTPYSCIKIINSSVGPGESHGCPFKHWEQDNLRKKIIEYGMSTEGITDVMDLVKRGHYQIACSKYFMYTHGGAESKALISHPNQYYEESQEIKNNSKDRSSQKTSQNKSQRYKPVKCDYCEMEPCICSTRSVKDVINDNYTDSFNPGDFQWEEFTEEELQNTNESPETVEKTNKMDTSSSLNLNSESTRSQETESETL